MVNPPLIKLQNTPFYIMMKARFFCWNFTKNYVSVVLVFQRSPCNFYIIECQGSKISPVNGAKTACINEFGRRQWREKLGRGNKGKKEFFIPSSAESACGNIHRKLSSKNIIIFMARQQGAMLECHRLLCIRVQPIVHQKVPEKLVRQRK